MICLRHLSGALLPAIVLVGGCSSEPDVAAPIPLTAVEAVPALSMVEGKATPRNYAAACGTCHDNGGFAVRVLADRSGPENSMIHERNDLAPDAIRAIVRNGFGAMPAMSKLEVSDEELDGIIAFLGKARRGSAPQ